MPLRTVADILIRRRPICGRNPGVTTREPRAGQREVDAPDSWRGRAACSTVIHRPGARTGEATPEAIRSPRAAKASFEEADTGSSQTMPHIQVSGAGDRPSRAAAARRCCRRVRGCAEEHPSGMGAPSPWRAHEDGITVPDRAPGAGIERCRDVAGLVRRERAVRKAARRGRRSHP